MIRNFNSWLNENQHFKIKDLEEYTVLEKIAAHLQSKVTGSDTVQEMTFVESFDFHDVNTYNNHEIDFFKTFGDNIENINDELVKELYSSKKYEFPVPHIDSDTRWSGIIRTQVSTIKIIQHDKKLANQYYYNNTIEKETYCWNFISQDWEYQGKSIPENLSFSELQDFLDMLEKPVSQMHPDIKVMIDFAKGNIEKITPFEFLRRIFTLDAKPFDYYGNITKRVIDKWKLEVESFLMKNKISGHIKVTGRKYGL